MTSAEVSCQGTQPRLLRGNGQVLLCWGKLHTHSPQGYPTHAGYFLLTTLHLTAHGWLPGLSAIPSLPSQVTKKSQGLSQSGLPPQLPPHAPSICAFAQSAAACSCPRTQFVVRGMFPHPVEEGPGALSSLKGSANWNPSQPIRDEAEIPLEWEPLKIDSWLGFNAL